MKYKRTLAELRSKAVLHWPEDILHAAVELSVLPLLLKTQDSFISLLKVANRTPEAWREAIKHNTDLSGPIFLKHLMVITDIGGEALNKLPPLSNYCPNGIIKFSWNGKIWEYQFKEIQNKCSLANSALKVDSKRLLAGGELTVKMIDVAMLLLFGSAGINDSLPMEIKERCIVGTLLGCSEELDRFVKKNYIRVNRQVGGATSNALGQLMQDYVVMHLKSSLPSDWIVQKDSYLPNVFHTKEGNKTNFDVVVKSPQEKYFGIEVSFQVTTNSVIERKARESASLMASVHAAGHKICYVIDGSGNINIRKNAVNIICEHSDCTVAISKEEIKHLAAYLIEK
ncbi:hypothetical protein [Chromatium okenii]|uniref:hypothetical protein n=1 Tax=Chromatium okenii TaxID=61644 RepID=UPI0026F0DC09|nr:hypothetical protein [Chromatium okenii]MBV5309807.1 hypothetical protein [Chromatium okenii]